MRFLTPATVSIGVGLATVGILFSISEANHGDTSTTAGQLLISLCEMATKNAGATLIATGAAVTATVYTYAARPLSWMFEKCCKKNEAANEGTNLLYNATGPNAI